MSLLAFIVWDYDPEAGHGVSFGSLVAAASGQPFCRQAALHLAADAGARAKWPGETCIE